MCTQLLVLRSDHFGNFLYFNSNVLFFGAYDLVKGAGMVSTRSQQLTGSWMNHVHASAEGVSDRPMRRPESVFGFPPCMCL